MDVYSGRITTEFESKFELDDEIYTTEVIWNDTEIRLLEKITEITDVMDTSNTIKSRIKLLNIFKIGGLLFLTY